MLFLDRLFNDYGFICCCSRTGLILPPQREAANSTVTFIFDEDEEDKEEEKKDFYDGFFDTMNKSGDIDQSQPIAYLSESKLGQGVKVAGRDGVVREAMDMRDRRSKEEHEESDEYDPQLIFKGSRSCNAIMSIGNVEATSTAKPIVAPGRLVGSQPVRDAKIVNYLTLRYAGQLIFNGCNNYMTISF